MIGTIHHHGVVVSDLERSIRFYRDVLGMEEVTRFATDPERFGPLLGVAGGAADVAFLDADGFLVELEEHADSARNVNEGSADDVGVSHLCIEVDDIGATYKELADDVEFVSPPGRASDSGAVIAYFTDPDGNLIELIESPAV